MSLEPRSRRDFLRLTAAGLAVPAFAPILRADAFSVQAASANGVPTSAVFDVKAYGAEFFRIRAQHVREASIFSLKNVTDFSVAQSRPIADTVLEKVEDKKL
jgi:hypothetical protein